MDYCVRAYCAKNSDRQIKNLPIPTESQFIKFSHYMVYFKCFVWDFLLARDVIVLTN